MARFPPRIHVLLAPNALVGLVLRRGPSDSVASILWDRERDTFTLGQWLKGRIYERRSDLSPDGKHLIYFALNGQWTSESGGSWTAISSPPYLRALAMFPKGDGWNGGGLWTGKSTYWLNDGYGHTVLRDTTAVKRDRTDPRTQHFGNECLGVYYPRLLRDGWTLQKRENVDTNKDKDTFEKPIGKGWVLRKIAHAEIGAPPGKGCYWDEHEIVHAASGEVLARPTWEWAEIDGKRLVWAADGKLHGARVGKEGLYDEAELHDFNDMKFEAIKAPYG